MGITITSSQPLAAKTKDQAGLIHKKLRFQQSKARVVHNAMLIAPNKIKSITKRVINGTTAHFDILGISRRLDKDARASERIVKDICSILNQWLKDKGQNLRAFWISDNIIVSLDNRTIKLGDDDRRSLWELVLQLACKDYWVRGFVIKHGVTWLEKWRDSDPLLMAAPVIGSVLADLHCLDSRTGIRCAGLFGDSSAATELDRDSIMIEIVWPHSEKKITLYHIKAPDDISENMIALLTDSKINGYKQFKSYYHNLREILRSRDNAIGELQDIFKEQSNNEIQLSIKYCSDCSDSK